MTIIIKGQTPAQKNRKKVSCVGGRARLYTEKSVKEWQDYAHLQIKNQFKQVTIQSKVTIAYTFYVKDKRRRDSDNMVATVNDALVKAGVIKDDSWELLACGGYDAELDRDNPRAEIYISID